HVCTDRGSSDGAAGSRNVLATPAPNLVSQDAADHAADNRPRNVGATAFFDLAALDPAAFLRRAVHRMYRRDGHFVYPLAWTPAVVITDWRRFVAIMPHGSHRRNAMVQLAKRRVLARAQNHAAPVEIRVLACVPATVLHDGRRRTIVEPG